MHLSRSKRLINAFFSFPALKSTILKARTGVKMVRLLIPIREAVYGLELP